MPDNNLTRESVRRIIPYSPGKSSREVMDELGLSEVIKLASNENPLGPSPSAVEAMAAVLGDSHVYPDPVCTELTAALAKHLDVDGELILIGRGSDEIIVNLGHAFVNPGEEILFSQYPFSMYPWIALIRDAIPVEVPANRFDHDLSAIADRITDKTRLIFLGNPCNPTGTILRQREVEAFMARVPDHVIVAFDQAYFEYVDDPDYADCMDYVREGRNAVVMRTFSKIYGLAALRVGYGIAGQGLVEGLKKVREPFNVSTAAQAGALASLHDPDQVKRSYELVAEGRRYLYECFDTMGLAYVPTQGNFILVDTGRDSRDVFDALMRRGITVRTGDIFGLPTHIRVTFGTIEQNRRFIEALREVLAN